jgi:DNA-binding MarR family transcriptional regulator
MAAAKTKLYESLPQPNEAKPITIDTFSPGNLLVARIKCFNGVRNDVQIMAIYSHLLGWKKTTGQIRPSQQYIADCCCMGLSTVQKRVKLLEKMGWIKTKPVYKSGSKEIIYTDYTVKDPEAILTELNASLIQQGDAAVTIKKSNSTSAESPANGDKVVHVDFKKQAEIPDPQSTTWETGHKTPTINRRSSGPTREQMEAWDAEQKANGCIPF